MRPSNLSAHTSSAARFTPRAILLLLVVFALSSALVITQSGTLHAQTPEPGSPEGSYSESQAQGIDRMIMCPVCPAETIDQAQVEISFQMRQIVRDMLSQGSDRDEILDFFVERYGKDILAAPPKSGVNLVAWLMPIAAVSVGLITVYLVLRSMTRQRISPAIAQPVTDAGLIPYLQLVDRHLDMTRSAPQTGSTSNPSSSTIEQLGESLGEPPATGESEANDDRGEQGR
jgi:cytochrome c-type biogenesis protein CcmH